MATAKKAASKAVSAKSAAASLQGTPNVPATFENKPVALPAGFTVARNLQMPSLVMKVPGEARVLGFNSNLQVSGVKPKPNEAPATVADVTDLNTGEIFKFLVPSVVESSMIQAFGQPGDSTFSGEDRKDLKGRQQLYDNVPVRGKVLLVRNCGKREGKRHTDFEVQEVTRTAE